MIRLIVVLLTAVILAAHATYLEVSEGGSVLAFSLAKNLIVCTFMARWVSSFIGTVANLLLSNDSGADGPKKDEKKEPRQIPAESLSEAAFPTTGTSDAKSERPASPRLRLVEPVAQQPEPIPAKVDTLIDRVRRGDMPAVWRFRPQKQLSSRVLAIRV